MNLLLVGRSVTLPDVGRGFFCLGAKKKRAAEFSEDKHSIELLPMSELEAEEFAGNLYDLDGRGASTLTVRNGEWALTQALTKFNRLDEIEWGTSDEEKEAKMTIDRLLWNPAMRQVLCGRLKPTHRPRANVFSFAKDRSIYACLDHSKLGEKGTKILGNILISKAKGQVIIDDFGFYARPAHATLIREGRLIAAVNSLSEIPAELKSLCLLMEKDVHGATYDDATYLAKARGYIPGNNNYHDKVVEMMG